MTDDLMQQPTTMDNLKAEKVLASMVRDPETKEMKKRKKAKPLKVIERDTEIIRLMHIAQDATVVAQKMGVSKRRVYQIVSEYRDSMADELGKVDPVRLASLAKDRYEMLFNESVRLALEASKINDPKERIQAKANAYDKAMKAQAQLDNLFKLLGIYKEHSVVEHIDIIKTEEWIRMEEAIRIFLRYYVGVDPSVFTDFIERTQSDKGFFQRVKNRAEERERRTGMYGPRVDFDVQEYLIVKDTFNTQGIDVKEAITGTTSHSEVIKAELDELKNVDEDGISPEIIEEDDDDRERPDDSN